MAGSGGEKYPEVQVERVWDDIVKKLQQKEYTFDAATYGSVNEYVKKIAYFYHASIQGAGAYPGAADALRWSADRRRQQGLLADGQCFTTGQLQQCLQQQDPEFDPDAVIPSLCGSSRPRRRRRSRRTRCSRRRSQAAAGKGITPAEMLHVGSNLTRDIAPGEEARVPHRPVRRRQEQPRRPRPSN